MTLEKLPGLFELLFLHLHAHDEGDNNTVLLWGISKKQMWLRARKDFVDIQSPSGKISEVVKILALGL